MLLKEQREKIIEIALKVRAAKLVPLTFGNFSLRDPETGYICISPSGMDYEALKPEDVVVVDEDMNIIDGIRKPSVEMPMHCGILKARKDVGGVVHVHSVFATSWASSNKAIPPVLTEGASVFGGPIECAPVCMMGSEDLASTMIETLGDKRAVLMGNHGMITVGDDIDSAFKFAVLAEECAKVAFYSHIIGNSKPLSPEFCQAMMHFGDNVYGQQD